MMTAASTNMGMVIVNTNSTLMTVAGTPSQTGGPPPYQGTLTWTGLGGDDLWSNTNNWDPTRMPGSGTDIVITNAGHSSTVDQNFTIKSLTWGQGLNGNGLATANLYRGGDSVLTLLGSFVRPTQATYHLYVHVPIKLGTDLEFNFPAWGVYFNESVSGDHKLTQKTEWCGGFSFAKTNTFNGWDIVKSWDISIPSGGFGLGPVSIGSGEGSTKRNVLLLASDSYGFTNTITVEAGTTGTRVLAPKTGVNAALPARWVLDHDLIVFPDRSGYPYSKANTSLELSGDIAGSGGIEMDGIDTVVLTLSGDNTYDGGTTAQAGTVNVNGAQDSARFGMTNATLNVNGTVSFQDGETVHVHGGGSMTATNGAFDLTGLTPDPDPPVVLVDYAGGTFSGPASLRDLLSAGSLAQDWVLRDTGTQITAEAAKGLLLILW
jgi:autotransporter-associated beta strand protein